MRFSASCESHPCPVPPHPDVVRQWNEESTSQSSDFDHITRPHFGLNDGTIYQPIAAPPDPTGAAKEPNLRGPINVLVCMVEFQDKPFAAGAKEHFQDLFFSTGKVSTGSVTEYYSDVSSGKISITGKVEGPFKLPNTSAFYANGGFGIKDKALQPPNLQTMADDAVKALIAENFDVTPYDNHGRANGYVDALILVHSGRGGEQTNDANDIWSCKWVLPAERTVGTKKIYPFLTIPEDAKLGVCAHEIGHLIFGWPDLYDISYKNEGIGNWCLMSGGSWGGNPSGTTPTHPSAWCKLDQEWIDAVGDQSNGSVSLTDVKTKPTAAANASKAGNIHKLGPDGATTGSEYFLLETRMRNGYDKSMPGEGLLIWHIDDSLPDNDSTRGPHGRVNLMDASGRPLLIGRGDDSNPFPGSLKNRSFAVGTSPNSKSYKGADTHISVKNISDAGQTMTMDITVKT